MQYHHQPKPLFYWQPSTAMMSTVTSNFEPTENDKVKLTFSR